MTRLITVVFLVIICCIGISAGAIMALFLKIIRVKGYWVQIAKCVTVITVGMLAAVLSFNIGRDIVNCLIFRGDLYYEIVLKGDPYKLETIIDEEWVIGKTRKEIEEKYGQFDWETCYAILYQDNTNYPTVFIGFAFEDQTKDSPVPDGEGVCIKVYRMEGIPGD